MKNATASYTRAGVRWSWGLIVGLAALLVASGLLAFQPVALHAQSNGTSYFILYAGTADFTTPAEYGVDPRGAADAWGTTHDHVEWSASTSGASLEADGSLDSGGLTGQVGRLTITSLKGTRAYDRTKSPVSHPDRCTANFSVRPDEMLTYSLGLTLTVDGGYHLALEGFSLPADMAYMQSDNSTDLFCSLLPSRNGYTPEKMAGWTGETLSDWKQANIPLIAMYFDGSQALNQTQALNFDFTSPAYDVVTKDGSHHLVGTYDGYIHSAVQVSTNGPLGG